MTIYVITPCFNFHGKLDKYVASFIKSHDKFGYLTEFKFHFVFINDQPGCADELRQVTEPLSNKYGVTRTVLDNGANIGCTRSRNKGVRYIFDNIGDVDLDDYVIYFDADDIWDENSCIYLYWKLMKSESQDNMVFFPVDVSTIPINCHITGRMELGKFCTYIPLQECIYSWKLRMVKYYLTKYGWLWYEDDSPSTYFPEDMGFLSEPLLTCNVLNSVICHRNYDTGNIAHDWGGTILKNKSAFKKLIELHESNMKLFTYSKDLLDYVGYLRYQTGLIEIPNEASHN